MLFRKLFLQSPTALGVLPRRRLFKPALKLNVTQRFQWVPVLCRSHSTSEASIANKKKGIQKPKTSIMFTLSDTPGALQEALGYFSSNGLSMTRIESRPSKKTSDYEFYVDFQGASDDPTVQNLLKATFFFWLDAGQVVEIKCFGAFAGA